ncbi:hypothetical protein [Cohnella sp. REN36]|uniref:hypothetical protein n=1 Tax=Cohnella sp. REN36 TaxID=2887347 RepID=UPI001D133347|nr:hypothetical protein [Cohnella sp. REN36]MCC3377592.1 hypothetical protein [Cohnella sp. REN36]
MRDITFGLVTEGPTDFELITQLIQKIVPGEHRFLPLQPDLSATEGFGVHGGGWKGVFSWCEKFGADPGIFFYMNNMTPAIDVLIIHIDADISRDQEINCARPCPEAEATVIELENKLNLALNVQDLMGRIIFCIPSDNTEGWILAVFDSSHHNPPSQYIECIQQPEYIISSPQYKLIKRKEGKPKKNQSTYREKLIPEVLQK